MATIEKRSNEEGKLTYRVKVRLKGFPPQSASFNRITDAKKWAQNTEAAIREGRHFKTVESKRHTFGEMIDRYIKHRLPLKGSARNIRNQQSQLEWWKKQLGHYVLADVTPALVAEQRDNLSTSYVTEDKKTSPATVNRYLAALSHVYTIGVKEWGWIENNPVQKISRLREPRGRVRFLSDDERRALLVACQNSTRSEHLYLIVVLALSTGARHGEIINLTWDNIDFGRGVITLHKTKNGERRLLPLASHALDLMKAHAKVRRIDTDLVFPNRRGDKPADITTAFENVLKDAKIDDFRFHDLRHSAASYLVMNGASLAEIAEVLGHKTLQMVKRYAHLSEAHTSKVVTAMNEKIFQ